MLAQGIARAPFEFQRLILEKILQQVFSESLQDGDFEFLENRTLHVYIDDLDAGWYLGSHNSRLILYKDSQPVTLIRGRLNAFIRLLARREDPDTLFFQRDLIIEGNTEVGLEMKNLMDNLNLDDLPFPVKKGIALAAKIFL